MKTIAICKNCGSNKVEVKRWLNANTLKICDNDMFDDNDTWCNDCETHSGINYINEDLNNQNKQS